MGLRSGLVNLCFVPRHIAALKEIRRLVVPEKENLVTKADKIYSRQLCASELTARFLI